MQQITEITKIQSHLAELLAHFADFCKKHNLTFFLSNGTLIGAVKYQNFVPWDDDCDVMMPREDYDKFLTLYKEHYPHAKYRLLSRVTSETWRMPYAKLSDTATLLREGDYEFGEELGISLDIFPIDRWHPNKKRAIFQTFRAELYKRFLICANAPSFQTEKKGMKRLILWGIHITGKAFGWKRLQKKLCNMAEKSHKYPNTYVGCVAWCCHGTGEILPSCVFSNAVDVTFQGKTYPAPAGYDQYLTNLYGEWRKELPPEKQKSNHNIEVFKKDVEEI